MVHGQRFESLIKFYKFYMPVFVVFFWVLLKRRPKNEDLRPKTPWTKTKTLWTKTKTPLAKTKTPLTETTDASR